jgi:hypothetical protein
MSETPPLIAQGIEALTSDIPSESSNRKTDSADVLWDLQSLLSQQEPDEPATNKRMSLTFSSSPNSRPHPLQKHSSFEDSDSIVPSAQQRKARRASVGAHDFVRGRVSSNGSIDGKRPKTALASIAHVDYNTPQLLDSLPDADDDANIDGSDESDLTRHEPVSPVVVRRKSSEHSRSRSKLSSESSTSHEEDHISFPKVKIHRDRKLLKNPSEMSLNDSDSFADSLSSSDSTGNPEMKSSKSSDSVDSSPSSTRHSASAIPIRRVSRSVSYGPVPVPSSPTTPGRHAGFKLSSRTLKRTLKDVRERTVTFADILSGDSATSATLLILLPTFEGDFMKKWMQETFQIKALLERLGLRIIGVGPGSPSHARFFCSRTGCAFDIYVDPKGKLFRELGCVDVVTTAKSGLSPTDASPTVNYLGGWFHISGKYVLHQQIAAQVVSAKTIADFLSTNLSRSEPM